MNRCRAWSVPISILLTASTYAANPFLDAKDDKPVSANFRGAEWGDNISQDEIALTARVVTTRVVKMPWGAIFKIGFIELKSRAPQPRKIEPEYFVVTDDRIILLNEENNKAAVKKSQRWRSRQSSSRAIFMESPAANSITKRGRGRQSSNS